MQLEAENARLRERILQLESQGEQVMSNLLVIAGGPGINRSPVNTVPARSRAMAPSQWLRGMEERARNNPEVISPVYPKQ